MAKRIWGYVKEEVMKATELYALMNPLEEEKEDEEDKSRPELEEIRRALWGPEKMLNVFECNQERVENLIRPLVKAIFNVELGEKADKSLSPIRIVPGAMVVVMDASEPNVTRKLCRLGETLMLIGSSTSLNATGKVAVADIPTGLEMPVSVGSWKTNVWGAEKQSLVGQYGVYRPATIAEIESAFAL